MSLCQVREHQSNAQKNRNLTGNDRIKEVFVLIPLAGWKQSEDGAADTEAAGDGSHERLRFRRVPLDLWRWRRRASAFKRSQRHTGSGEQQGKYCPISILTCLKSNDFTCHVLRIVDRMNSTCYEEKLVFPFCHCYCHYVSLLSCCCSQRTVMWMREKAQNLGALKLPGRAADPLRRRAKMKMTSKSLFRTITFYFWLSCHKIIITFSYAFSIRMQRTFCASVTAQCFIKTFWVCAYS